MVNIAPAVVTLHFWGMPARQVPWALSRMARHRRLICPADNGADAVPGLRFAKLLGTGHGRTFTPGDADPRHWALLATWDSTEQAEAFESGRLITSWNDRSAERCRLRMRPLTSHGRWSKQEPFGPPRNPGNEDGGTGRCAILTRARLTPRKALTFWRAVPPVATAVGAAAGLRFARGIGEAPIGLQATFSIWDDLAAARTFAYRTPAHREAIDRTAETGWYAEQLFARFAVIDASGMVAGRDPLGVRSAAGEPVS